MDLYGIMGLEPQELLKILNTKKIFVSINGMDNVGKSTQAKLISKNYEELFSSPLHINQTEAFPKKSGAELSKWWFDKDNALEFVNTMYKAIKQRYEMGERSEKSIILLDKGIDFYDTRIKATLLTNGFSDANVYKMITKAKRDNGLVNSFEDLKIFITPDEGVVDHIKEKNAENDELYRKYMTKNIELLNKKLDEGKDFTTVKYIPNDIESMHENILKEIANKLNECTQIKQYDRIRKLATEIFEDDLNMVVLGGSAGKAKFINGWSDLDLYILLKDCNRPKIAQFLNKVKSDIHVGANFYSDRDLENDRLDNRTKMMFYELLKGGDQILYQKDGFQVPQYELQDILKNDAFEKIAAYSNLKRAILYSGTGNSNNRTFESGGSDENAKILKLSILLEKLLLRNSDKRIVCQNYFDTSVNYYDLVKLYASQFGGIEVEDLEKLGSTDLIECIKDFKNRETDIKNYGIAVLDTAEKML